MAQNIYEIRDRVVKIEADFEAHEELDTRREKAFVEAVDAVKAELTTINKTIKDTGWGLAKALFGAVIILAGAVYATSMHRVSTLEDFHGVPHE